MKKIIALALVLSWTGLVQAEKKSFKVKGMHCAGCVEMVEGEICEDSYQSCKVGLAKGEKNMGEIVIETKGDAKIVVADLKSKLAKAGEYELIEVKENTKKK